MVKKSLKREILTIGEPTQFKDLEKHERDTLSEHWVGLAKTFYSDSANRQRFTDWQNKKRPAA